MTAALVVLLGLQLGVEPDPADDAVERIAAGEGVVVDVVAVVNFGVDVRIPAPGTVTGRLASGPPQQPAQSVEVGTAAAGLRRRQPQARGRGGHAATARRPDVDSPALLLQLGPIQRRDVAGGDGDPVSDSVQRQIRSAGDGGVVRQDSDERRRVKWSCVAQ